ncbi:acyl carrier protein [Streptomyces sp. NPDC001380]|uniref:acyl carrier protein n=1 Tax=Streptomyces sp. NPDC001380 TaxID=3364566 RepID=UPI0036783BE7
MTTTIATPAEFVGLLRDATGLDLGAAELDLDYDRLPGWDSLHLLKLVSALERATGRRVPVGRVLETRSLAELHSLAVAG